MKVYLARHGRTNYNDLELCNGDSSVDVHLTEVGKQQAQKLAQDLKDVPFEKIFISELPRTRQTADFVNEYHQLELVVDSRLNDNLSGFEGKPYAEYEGALAATDDMWAYVAPGGESLNNVYARVEKFIDDLRNQTEACVLVITSLVTAQNFLGVINHLSKDEIWALEFEQASYQVLDI